MATTRVPVVFGYSPEGARQGRVRVRIPEQWSVSAFRSAVRRGRVALSGPSSQHEASIGLGYTLLMAYMVRDGFGGRKQDGWNVLGRASVVV